MICLERQLSHTGSRHDDAVAGPGRLNFGWAKTTTTANKQRLMLQSTAKDKDNLQKENQMHCQIPDKMHLDLVQYKACSKVFSVQVLLNNRPRFSMTFPIYLDLDLMY